MQAPKISPSKISYHLQHICEKPRKHGDKGSSDS